MHPSGRIIFSSTSLIVKLLLHDTLLNFLSFCSEILQNLLLTIEPEHLEINVRHPTVIATTASYNKKVLINIWWYENKYIINVRKVTYKILHYVSLYFQNKFKNILIKIIMNTKKSP